ncbi:uncharacterized protein LACBIDRAFT_329862 [Laccaria bicolor S238N-H82]|uniref:Predicted protein n=1 Tax=Laccaria bicolor (strain S238N-H82 / ATCC MYA-4686) TaxID=486041 RepID=B0DJH1_LACBS|nr:uncharacterized protein LACBIDRAFT_329862 [Laccaria bicolor S238N-H82]EDR05206.1 predicted protein [Laccaria bicolor S238N-H82]|eukprot:XP_001884171.1 predicted protein [Laccaria bicolor S238N-H82]
MPETQTHKRKRSHQGIPTDMRERMMSSLDVLREKYSGIEKTEEEMAEVEKNVDECHRFLEERKVTFSDASKVELENLNVKTGRLLFNPRKIDQLAQARAQHVVGEQLKDLGSRLQKIYRRVNMMCEKGKNGDYQEYLVSQTPTELEGLFRSAAGHFFLIEAELRSPEWDELILEAVAQAMTISSNANLNTVRFCVSDGTYFAFYVLKKKRGVFTYYGSIFRKVHPDDDNFDDELQVIINLLLEWLQPTRTDLYQLKENPRFVRHLARAEQGM